MVTLYVILNCGKRRLVGVGPSIGNAVELLAGFNWVAPSRSAATIYLYSEGSIPRLTPIRVKYRHWG